MKGEASVQVNIFVDPETEIRVEPLPGHDKLILSFGHYGRTIFARPDDLARIARIINARLAELAPAPELTREIDLAEAERFRRECERDLKGEDE